MRDRLRACMAWGGCKQVLCNGERPSRLSLCQRQFAPDAGHLSFKEVARFLISWQDGFERRCCARKCSPQDVGQRQVRRQIAKPNHRAACLRTCYRRFQTDNRPVGFQQQKVQLTQRAVGGGDPFLVLDGGSDVQGLVCMGQRRTECAEGGQNVRGSHFDKGLPRWRVRLTGQKSRFFGILHTFLACEERTEGGFNRLGSYVQGSRSKSKGQSLPVAQATEQLNRSSLELLHRPGRVSHEKRGRAKHLERLSHALPVGLRFKQAQRLLVGTQRLLDAAGVLQPVAQEVEAASTQRCVCEFLGQHQRLAKPLARPFVIVSGPQKADGHHALPFHCAIMSSASGVERSLIITVRMLKVAQRFISLPACKREARRWCLGEVVGSLLRTGEVVNGSPLRIEREGLCPGLLLVGQRLLPYACLRGVVGQVFQVSLAEEGSGGKALQCFSEAAMQPLALTQQQFGIDGLLG